MTLGQRIAQKRKEQGLSQEALGSALGVSRQAIYKWESDATFPEIEKLIAMSRLFSVPVGWLLGVEEESAPAAAGAELSEEQLAMVQEIVDRYLSALPGPAPALSPGRRRLGKVCVALGALCMAAALWSLSRQLSRLDQRYMDLQNTVGGIQSNVSAQIGGISSRVEEILKAQNDLTADYGTEIRSTNPAGNMVTFSFRAVPRTFQEGMTAWFEVDNGVSRFTFGPYSPSGQTFAGEAEVALTDSMSLYIVFEHDGVRETQLLDQYSGLWSDSMPQFLHLASHEVFFWEKLDESGVFTRDDVYSYVDLDPGSTGRFGPASIRELRMGIFLNRELVQWGESCGQPDSWHGNLEDARFFRFDHLSFPMAEGDQVTLAVWFTDEYGREAMWLDGSYTPVQQEDGSWELEMSDPYLYGYDLPEHWGL